ncbi:MAG: DUF2628 domain-containing protein [Hyphomicrobiaceae bacterium]
MIVYTVHEPPDPPADKLDRAASLVFVRDRFSWGALLFGPLWLLASRFWLAFAAYLLAAVLIVVAVMAAGIGAGWIALLLCSLHLIIGFEAASIERWTLERKGWHMLGVVTGRSAEDCERRFFESWLPGEPHISGTRLTEPAAGLAGLAGQMNTSGRMQTVKPGWRSILSR